MDDDVANLEPAAAPESAGAPPESPTGRRWRFVGGRGRSGRPRRRAPWWELPALIVAAVLIAITVKTFVVQPFFIPSASMEHTLHGCPGCSGDRILVNKLVYDVRDPHPGDIVVFNAPPGWNDEPAGRPPHNPLLRVVRGFGQLVGFVSPDGEVLVKRVIATGGQTVEGDNHGTVRVSDAGPHGTFRTLHEPFVFDGTSSSQPAFGPVTVPKGRLWVEGDHRTNSEDSRYHCSVDGVNDNDDTTHCAQYVRQATVPVGNVIGKAFVIAWPPSRWRTLGTPSTFTASADAAGAALPAAASFVAVAPVFLVRRRGRRSGDRRR